MGDIRVLAACGDSEICENIKKVFADLDFDAHICGSGEDALAMSGAQSFDIVMSYHQLSDMTGFEVLERFKDLDKFSTRIIVGDDASEELIIKSVIKGVACTYISGSTCVDTIRRKLEDVARVRRTIGNSKLLEILPGSEDFPIRMTVYEKFMDAVANDCDMYEIAEIISEDVALSAKVLRVANSAFYGNFNGTSVEKAVVYMGLNSVKDIVLTHSLTTNLSMNQEQDQYLEDIVKHSVETNYYMHAIAHMAPECPVTPLNSSIGIIHDIGKIVQLVFFSIEHKSIEEYRKDNPELDYYTCEIETNNVSIKHNEIGAYFLRCWNFNQYSIEAALYHHEPESSSEDIRPCVEALFLANTVADYRDGFKVSLEKAVERCEKLNITVKQLERIMPPKKY